MMKVAADRSKLAEVRNPLLRLESAQAIMQQPPQMKAALRQLLLDLRAESQVLAQKSWQTHKAPMALYWKCLAVYAGHIAKLLK